MRLTSLEIWRSEVAESDSNHLIETEKHSATPANLVSPARNRMVDDNNLTDEHLAQVWEWVERTMVGAKFESDQEKAEFRLH